MKGKAWIYMRLGIDASNLREGGGLTHLAELLRAAEPGAHGFDQVLVWGGAATLARLENRPWLRLIHEPMLDMSLPVRLYWQTAKLAVLAIDNCDVLFAPGGNVPKGNCTFVTMCRNMLPFESPEARRYGISVMGLKVRLLRRAQARSFKRADGVIFLTQYAKDVIEREIGPLSEKHAVIPHGVNHRFRQEPRPAQPIDAYSRSRPFRWLYVSKVDMYKHQWHVVEALAELRTSGWPVALDLVGGAYRPAIRRLRKARDRFDVKCEFIEHHGEVPYNNLENYYHSADGAIFASSCENHPNILVEAMASGLPIACSNRGPMPEILGDAGVYFDPERPEEIAAACRTLMDDPYLREQKAWAAYECSREYSWERCARRTFSFLQDASGLHRE